jgi:hypothetical protein
MRGSVTGSDTPSILECDLRGTFLNAGPCYGLALRLLATKDEAVRYLPRPIASLVALSIAVSACVGSADAGRTKLVGSWDRIVRDGSVLGASHRGVWAIHFGTDGVAIIYEPVGAHVPGVRDTFTAAYQATASGRLVMAAGTGCATAGIYRWSLTGVALRISKVTDVCLRRIAVIQGVWSRTQRIRGAVAPHP